MITNFLTFLQDGTKFRYMVGLYSDKLSRKNLNKKLKYLNTQKKDQGNLADMRPYWSLVVL